jgi:hypothetical protein
LQKRRRPFRVRSRNSQPQSGVPQSRSGRSAAHSSSIAEAAIGASGPRAPARPAPWRPQPLPTLAQVFAPDVLASWGFLVLAGSLAAYTIYLKLLRDWGPLRAGMFAFVSPIVAVALGALIYGEAVTSAGMLGMGLMLGAAAAVPRG